MDPRMNRRSLQILLYLAFWTLFALYFTSESYIFYQTQSTAQYTFWFMFLLIVPEALAWIPLGLIAIAAADRFPFTRSTWLRIMAVHTALCLVIALVHSVIHAYLAGLIGVCQQMPAFIGRPFDLSEHISFNLVLRFHRNVLTYCAIVGAVQGLRYYGAYRDRQLHASILETQLAESRLQALKLQLQPHFLFNTMHTVSSLIHTDPDTARRMLVRLSELLRMTLTGMNVQEHTLNEEMVLVEKYLEIERTRFEDKLQVAVDIGDGTGELRVPNLLLQPLVENAVRHGIERSSAPGTVSITSRTSNGMLTVRIGNPGPIRNGAEPSLGIGLSSTRDRLQQLYGDRSSFRLFEQNGHTIAELTIPVRA
ncbi:MAG: histidine kinase [Bacteroidetes bacterium]|nr:histidine kinase [Bacteroidota bacterium]